MAAIQPPRDEVVRNFLARSAASRAAGPERTLRSIGLYVPNPFPPQPYYLPCTKALDSLKPMLISQMKASKHHRGRYVVVRVCTPPGRRQFATAAVVEDRRGTAIPLFLYNMSIDAAAHDVDPILSEGTICLIKEPLLKPKKKENAYNIRVDHVTDIVFLDATDSRVPDVWKRPALSGSSDEIRAQGNAHFKSNNWSSALRFYSKAIDVAQTDEQKQLAYINRALVNLRLDRYQAAMSDSTQMAGSPAPTTKGLYRLAMAHYGLQDFVKCRDALVQLLTASPDEPAAKYELERVEERLHEQTTGQYSFARMHEQDRKNPGLVDCASYYGPVEVRESPGRGRGLFLTKAVSVGDLILCEKALAYNRREPALQNMSEHVSVKVEGTPVDPKAKAELSAQLHQKLLHNYETHKPLLDLYSGTQQFERNSAEAGAGVVIDSFLVNSIIDFNAVCIEAGAPSHGGKVPYDRYTTADGGSVNGRPPSDGVWLKASYMNHACYPTCQRVFIGDMVVVRATRKLRAGTELTVSYVEPSPFETAEKVGDKLTRWEFACVCDLCAARRRCAERETRSRRPGITRIAAEAFTQGPKRDELLRACDDMDALYPAYAGPSGAPCVEIWTLSFPRRRALLESPEHGALGVIDGIAAALRALNFDVSEHTRASFAVRAWGMVLYRLPETFSVLHEAYREVNPRVCPIVREYARTAFRVLVGEDETFYQAFPNLATT